MEGLTEEVEVKLSAPVKYGKDNLETEFVFVRCPNFGDTAQRKYYTQLKAMLAKVFLDLSERNTGEVDPETPPGEINADALVLLLAGSLGESFADHIERFIKHCKGFVFLGGEEPLRDGPALRMHPDDVHLIFGTFIANFIMPSLTRSMTGKK